MESKIYDVMILGGGPGGLAAGLYAGRSKLSTVIIEKGIDGGQIAITHEIENYPGQANVDGMTGQALVAPMTEQCKKFGVERVSDTINSCDFSGTIKKFIGNKGEYLAKSVIICTGAMTRFIGCKNEAKYVGKGVSYCAVCDGFFYRGKTVAVLGSGEYADSEAAELKPLAETVIKLDDIDAIERFSGDVKIEKVEFKDGTTQDIDGLFIAFGTAGPGDLAKKIGIMTDANKLIVNDEMATNVPGIYAAGDCTGGLLQVSKAVCDGAKAATAAIKYLRG